MVMVSNKMQNKDCNDDDRTARHLKRVTREETRGHKCKTTKPVIMSEQQKCIISTKTPNTLAFLNSVFEKCS